MTALTELTIVEARAGLAQGSFSAKELAEAHVRAVEVARPLNAFISETPERALAMAAASDARLQRGEADFIDTQRPLHGVALDPRDQVLATNDEARLRAAE